MDKHYTIADVALAYDLHPETVREFCRDGVMEFSRVGRCYRFTEEQLKKYELKCGAGAERVRSLERVIKHTARAR